MQKINLNKMRIYSHDLSFKLSNLNKKKKLYNSAEKFQFFLYNFLYEVYVLLSLISNYETIAKNFSSYFYFFFFIFFDFVNKRKVSMLYFKS